MAIPAASSALPAGPATPQRTADEVGREFNERLVASIRAIAGNNQEHLDRQDPERVLSGIWYPNQQLEALRRIPRAQARLDHFTQKGAFFHGWLDPKTFDRLRSTGSITGFAVSSFQSKPGIPPSVALQRLREGPSMIGCGEACLVAMHESLREILGEEKYNALFDPLVIIWNNPIAPIDPLLYTRVTQDAPFPAGTLVRISNVANYALKHLMGEASGYNLIATGDGRFIGLGTSPEGMTREEIHQLLLDEFNKPPLGMDMVSPALGAAILGTYNQAALEANRGLRNVQINMRQFTRQGGGAMHVYGQVNIARVTELANRTIAEGQALLAHWRAERPS